MHSQVIAKQELAAFVENLLRQGEVVGVRRKDGKYVFDKIGSPGELCLDYDVTVLSPKEYFLPQREAFLKFELAEAIKAEPITQAQRRIILGVHPYDIKAIQLMDAVFSKDNPDPNYFRKREAATIIGVDCLNPSPHAFCASVGTATAESGFDLLLTDIGAEYVVAIGSAKGEELLQKHAKTRDASDGDLSKGKTARDEAARKYQLSAPVSLDQIPRLLEENYDHPLWEELAQKCLSCGSCTMVCPTCVCFDVQEDVALTLTTGERYRQWDSCLLEDFAKVATGENFRQHRSTRLRHRYFRKGKYMMERFGIQGCVGCGRCITACLAEIASPVDTYSRLKGGS